jgi:hypothetical protein
MVCDFINHLISIFPQVKVLQNNILGVIEEMWSRVDIKDKK